MSAATRDRKARARKARAAASRARDAVLAAWYAANGSQEGRELIAHGRDWYPRELARISAIGEAHGVDVDTAVAVAAVLSPATPWVGLVGRLGAFLAAALAGDPRPDFPTYGRQRELAASIARARSGVTLVSGPKVRPFALALLGDGDAVVIDRHAARIARVCAVNELPTPGQLTAARHGYRMAARELDVPPRDLQAAVWVWALGAAKAGAGPLARPTPSSARARKAELANAGSGS